jgi:Spx/MgsR family transcriptional regulator
VIATPSVEFTRTGPIHRSAAGVGHFTATGIRVARTLLHWNALVAERAGTVAEIELYLYAGCTSCRKAQSMLDELGVDYVKREFFKQRFTPEELGALLQRIGKTPNDVLSTRSRPYAELDLAKRNPEPDELIQLMIEHPQLLKRPMTVRGSEAVVGFNAGAIRRLVEGID